VASLRDQEVRFPFDEDAAEVNRVERTRQLKVLRAVPLDEWSRPSRCAEWSVHDVVRHVVQMNELVVGAAEASRTGERNERLRGFDPRTTPSAWLAEAPAAEPGETLAAFDATTRAVIDAGGALGADVLVGSPVGRQPWPRVLLHALLDALVHERDVTEPLGRAVPAVSVPVPVPAYALLLAARVACAYGREFAVRLDVGEQALDVAVRGAVVAVEPASGAADAAVDPYLLLDGLTGRVPLAEVFAAPDDVHAALELLPRSF
jgi:uncharacterized protein (TIGR03083 family)